MKRRSILARDTVDRTDRSDEHGDWTLRATGTSRFHVTSNKRRARFPHYRLPVISLTSSARTSCPSG